MPLRPASLDCLSVPPLRDGLLVLFALALRLPLLPLRRVIEGDGAIYASLARQAAHGDVGGLANPYWSNLWPAAIACASATTGLGEERAARLLSLAAGVLLAPLAARLAGSIFGSGAAALAGLAVAAHPWLAHFSTLAFTEAFYAALVCAALLAGVRALARPGVAAAGGAGGLAGLAFLARPEAWALPLVLGPALAWWGRRERRVPYAALAALGLAFGGVVAGRALLVHHYYDSWDLGLQTKGTANLLVGMARDEIARERLAHGVTASGATPLEEGLHDWTLATFAVAHPGAVARALRSNLERLAQLAPRVLPPLAAGLVRPPRATAPAAWVLAGLLLLLALAGLWVGLGDAARRPAAGLVGGVLAVSLAGLALLHLHERLLVAHLPLALVLAGGGAAAGASQAGRARAGLGFGLGALVVAAGAVGVGSLRAAPALAYAEDPPALEQAGLWLRSHVSQDGRVMTALPAVSFYFHETAPIEASVDLPWAEYPVVLARARSAGAAVVAAPEWHLDAGGFPSAGALRPEGEHPGLEPLASFGVRPRAVHLYRVLAERGARP